MQYHRIVFCGRLGRYETYDMSQTIVGVMKQARKSAGMDHHGPRIGNPYPTITPGKGSEYALCADHGLPLSMVRIMIFLSLYGADTHVLVSAYPMPAAKRYCLHFSMPFAAADGLRCTKMFFAYDF